uniref:50S ribosomal protein L3 N(5)-glutamine methyltransferase n=1 Tax=Candidatus Aschnera chinzeii TaxID=1485666 RepID=A0AAT9G4B0_9ENTR|nr:MAG: 50S ribosomal protein L3 N(5)-glutamine methyltransferase [Candidatus Aschnera chinzeii]
MSNNKYKLLTKELQSIKDMLRWTISQFNSSDIFYGHGTNNAIDEAKNLILPTLFLPINTPEILLTSLITTEERLILTKRIIMRINKHIPVSYLTNKSWFCGHELYIDKRALIPRSPIAELINNNFKNIIKYKPKYILDMCTGSGCIAIACAYKFPDAYIDAVDISIDALNVAEINIKQHNLSDRIMLIQSNLFQNLSKSLKYDLIISNPPYVKKNCIMQLPTEYLTEPKIALIGGEDGLKFIINILLYASYFLKKNGSLICEVGDNMSAIINKFKNINFNWLKFKYGGNGVFSLTYQQCCEIQKYLHYINQ